jgi:ABC-2 type transport system ATP-binding protein
LGPWPRAGLRPPEAERPAANETGGAAPSSCPRWAGEESALGKDDSGLYVDHVYKAKRRPGLKGRPLPILEGVTIAIRPGEAVGVVGPNGVGKTTLFKVAVGLWRPDQGRVLWRGRDDGAAQIARRGEIGVVGELAPLYPYLSAQDHLEMKRRLFPGVGAARIADLKDALGMGRFWTVPADRLSQGQRQRVALATALLPDPPLLLLDEATNGLDPDTVLWVRDTVRNLVGRGTSVCAASHVLGDLVKMVDRVVFLKSGQVVAEEVVGERTGDWLENRYRAVMGLPLAPLA